MDKKTLRDTYRQVSEEGGTPKAIITRGDVLLQHRPDLEGDVDPTKMYLITEREVTEMEEE